MLNKEQLRKQVIQYFRSVGSGQNIVQCIKEALFLHERFSPVMLFEVLSKGKQKITASDIRQYLVSHNIMFGEDQFKYYLHQNCFKTEITLNEFLQTMIPYNADVVRQFKSKYLQSLEIREFDPEVEFIFSELIDNELKFYRSLINIRQDITKISTKKQIEALVKEDLVLQSKPREARKFHQSFQNKHFELSFHELRKFLETWVSSKEIIHQFYLLNIMRHLKSSHPFEKIVFKSKKYRSQSASGQKRPFSAVKKPQEGLTNEKIRESIEKDYKAQTGNYFFSGAKEDKYGNYKNEVINDYIKDRENISDKKRSPPREVPSNNLNQSQPQNEALRRSKYEREMKGIDATFLLNILEEVVIKEERLEKLRKNLAKYNDFNLINLFKLIDVRNKGYATSKDVYDFTGSGKVQYNHMVNFYARQPEKLRFHEFCLVFRPLSKQLNEQIDNRQEHKVPNPFKKDTMKLILEVLALTADMHSNIANIKQNINSAGININDYFRFIDLEGKGYISSRCFQNVLTENNVFCDETDLKCLMKLFRKKVDERISQQEFVSFVDL